jgi:hypothetical protein
MPFPAASPQRRRRQGAVAAAIGLLLAILLSFSGEDVEALLVRPPRLGSQRQQQQQSPFGRASFTPLTMMGAGGGGAAEGSGSGSSSGSSKAKASLSAKKGPGRGFGGSVRRGSGAEAGADDGGSSGGGSSKPGRSRRGGRPPNSFSALGQAVRHRGKFGHNAPLELGLLDMSTKLMERHEAVKERYAGARPVQAGGGRQRGAKKAAAFHALSSYSLHFLKCVASMRMSVCPCRMHAMDE